MDIQEEIATARRTMRAKGTYCREFQSRRQLIQRKNRKCDSRGWRIGQDIEACFTSPNWRGADSLRSPGGAMASQARSSSDHSFPDSCMWEDKLSKNKRIQLQRSIGRVRRMCSIQAAGNAHRKETQELMVGTICAWSMAWDGHAHGC